MIPRPAVEPQESVLIVDQSDQSREVLRTVLERRGVMIYEASGAEDGLRLARRHCPNVIVLDLEAIPTGAASATDRLGAQWRACNTPMVLLGNARRAEASLSNSQVVRKPYHYGPLIRKIEGLIERTRTGD